MAKVQITIISNEQGVGMEFGEIEKCACGQKECVSPAAQLAAIMIQYANSVMAQSGIHQPAQLTPRDPKQTIEEQMKTVLRNTNPGVC